MFTHLCLLKQPMLELFKVKMLAFKHASYLQRKKRVAFGKGSVVGPQREGRLHFSLCAAHI